MKRVMPILLAFLMTEGCKKPVAPQSEPPLVELSQAYGGEIRNYVDALGKVMPSSKVFIRPLITAHVAQRHFTRGQQVEKGDRLFSLNCSHYEANLNAAMANLESSKAAADNLKLKYKRSRKLEQSKYISKQELQDIAASLKEAVSEVKSSEAALEIARLEIKHCHIDAPSSGKIDVNVTEVGNVATPSDVKPMATILQNRPIKFELMVTQSNAHEVMRYFEGQANESKEVLVDIAPSGDADRKITSRLVAYNNQYHEASGSLTVVSVAENTDGKLMAGQFVHAKIWLEPLHNAVLIPSRAIKTMSHGSVVYVYDNNTNTVELRPVKTGKSYGENQAILSGLRVGEKVVTQWGPTLYPGAKVKTKEIPNIKPKG